MARPSPAQPPLRATAVLVAAGPGIRLGLGEPKGFVPLAGVPMFIRALRALVSAQCFSSAVVVVPPGRLSGAEEQLKLHGPWSHPVELVEGGAERQDSVRNGLERCVPGLVAVHDAARPFTNPSVIRGVVDAAREWRAAVAAVPATDTIKQVGTEGWIERTLERESIWLAQTPQVFHTDLLRAAHEQAARSGARATDDAALVEALGIRVRVVRANPENRKITTREDLLWAEWVLRSASEPR